MKKIALMAAMACAALLFAGCSSLQVADAGTFNNQAISTSGTGIAHVSAYTSGFYFLWIPLLSGSAEDPGAIAINQDTCNINTVTGMVTGKSKALRAGKTVDLVSSCSSTMLPAPIPFLFYWKTVTVSGNAIR
ncbi:MAG: hypothetical protein J6R85_02440 [Lentisphaeria bacterium]|nr:hypothetical protein [Lentisphaeria bacterium]